MAFVVIMATSIPSHALSKDGEGVSGGFARPALDTDDLDRSTEAVVDFRLVGVAVSSSPFNTLAIIELGPDRRQKFIHEGDSIGQASVKKILNDRVLFDTDQGERVVALNRAYQDSGSPEKTLLVEQSGDDIQPVTSRKQTVEVDGQKLSAALADINKTLQDVNFNAVKIYGRPAGVRISPIKRGSVFASIGLKTGDIITSVDGEPVKNPEEALALLERIRAGGEFDIVVKGSRHSRKIQLVVN